METCLCDILQLLRENVYPDSKKVIIIIDTNSKEKEIEELKETIQRTRIELKQILASKSSTELLDVQSTLRAANTKMQDYTIKINRKKNITIETL